VEKLWQKKKKNDMSVEWSVVKSVS
jgi:hypothetical protein